MLCYLTQNILLRNFALQNRTNSKTTKMYEICRCDGCSKEKKSNKTPFFYVLYAYNYINVLYILQNMFLTMF